MRCKELGEKYGVDFGKANDMKEVSDWLKEQGFPSLAKLLDKE